MSNSPIRIQRSRAEGWRMPPDTVYVGRPTEWGNPFLIGSYQPHPLGHLGDVLVRDDHHATVLFDNWLVLTERGRRVARNAKAELRGKNLACWCSLDRPCHADVLLRKANE